MKCQDASEDQSGLVYTGLKTDVCSFLKRKQFAKVIFLVQNFPNVPYISTSIRLHHLALVNAFISMTTSSKPPTSIQFALVYIVITFIALKALNQFGCNNIPL